MASASLRLFFDGGCRPNPGTMELAVVVGGQAHIVRDAGHGDNSDAEWGALIAAAVLARERGVANATFLGDSALVIAQASGAAPPRTPRLRAHLATYRDTVAGIARVHVRLIKRSRNLAGIALAAAHPR